MKVTPVFVFCALACLGLGEDAVGLAPEMRQLDLKRLPDIVEARYLIKSVISGDKFIDAARSALIQFKSVPLLSIHLFTDEMDNSSYITMVDGAVFDWWLKVRKARLSKLHPYAHLLKIGGHVELRIWWISAPRKPLIMSQTEKVRQLEARHSLSIQYLYVSPDGRIRLYLTSRAQAAADHGREMFETLVSAVLRTPIETRIGTGHEVYQDVYIPAWYPFLTEQFERVNPKESFVLSCEREGGVSQCVTPVLVGR